MNWNAQIAKDFSGWLHKTTVPSFSRRHKHSVLNDYFRVKYIDTQRKCVFCFLHVDHFFCQNVLLISGALTVAMTACARMEQNVIHETVLVPAPLGGRGRFVRSHVTKVTMVTNVKNSVDAWMVAHVTPLLENSKHLFLCLILILWLYFH